MVKIKLALECPTAMLEMVQPFGDFDWILGHKVLESQEYLEYYKEPGRLKIIDNSVNEVGEPLSLEDMEKVLSLVGGDLLVSPDWIGDALKTVGAYGDCIKKFGKEKVIGVIQGETFEEALRCLSIYGSEGLIAVPYDVCSKKTDLPSTMALRRALVVCNIPNNTRVHLLGFNSLDEFFWYSGRPNVVSIDTGVPVMLGLDGLDILDSLGAKEAPTLSRMEKIELTQQGWTGVIRNIALLRRYLP